MKGKIKLESNAELALRQRIAHLTVKCSLRCHPKPRKSRVDQFFLNFFGNCWKLFGCFLENVWTIFGPPGGALGPPQGAQNGPRDPGDRFKIPPKNFKNLGQKCLLFFEILIFGFGGVFLKEI